MVIDARTGLASNRSLFLSCRKKNEKKLALTMTDYAANINAYGEFHIRTTANDFKNRRKKRERFIPDS